MKIYDVSVGIDSDIPTWPGDPLIDINRIMKIEEGADSNVSQIIFTTHSGTHIDTPYHFFEDGETLENIPINRFIGRVYVMYLPDVDQISAELLRKTGLPKRAKRILFKTRNSKLWKKYGKKFEKDYVGLSRDAAQYLIDKDIDLVGIDYLSIATYNDPVSVHKLLLRSGVIIIEGLDLSAVHQGHYNILCLPLKINRGDGAPARVVLTGA